MRYVILLGVTFFFANLDAQFAASLMVSTETFSAVSPGWYISKLSGAAMLNVSPPFANVLKRVKAKPPVIDQAYPAPFLNNFPPVPRLHDGFYDMFDIRKRFPSQAKIFSISLCPVLSKLKRKSFLMMNKCK